MNTRTINVFKIAAVLFVTALVFFSFAQVVSAEERTCDCYCSVEGQGATQYPDAKTKVVSSDCYDLCRAADSTVNVCAFDTTQLPSMNPLCFAPGKDGKDGSCEGQGGELDTKFQPPECLPGWYYCYPATAGEKTTLQVQVGNLTSTNDYGEYINTAYTWLVGIAGFIAIVFIMIGGLQYAVAAGHGDTANAKKRIKNAVVGLVLLFSTWLILHTVNPNLLNLTVPKFPMIRQVQLVDPTSSCGYLTGEWGSTVYHTYYGAPLISPFNSNSPPPQGGKPYILSEHSNGKECGSVAKVDKDWEGNDMIEGSTCTYDYCQKKGDDVYRCVGSGADAQCARCTDIIAGQDTPIKASSSVCDSFSLADTQRSFGGHQVLDQRNECFKTQNPKAIVGWTDAFKMYGWGLVPVAGPFLAAAEGAKIAAETAEAVIDGVCAEYKLDCPNVRSCRDYDSVEVTTGYKSFKMDDLEPSIFPTEMDLKTLCEDDPCNAHPPEESCVAVEAGAFLVAGLGDFSLKYDCVNSGSKANGGTSDYLDRYGVKVK